MRASTRARLGAAVCAVAVLLGGSVAEAGNSGGDSRVSLSNGAEFELGWDILPIGGGSPVISEASLGQLANPLNEAMGFSVGDSDYIEGEWDVTRKRVVVGPDRVGRLRITTTYRAIPDTTTLRVLIRLRNVTRRAVNEPFTFAGSLWSGDDTAVEDTSSGNMEFNAGDNWVITSEDDDLEDGFRSPAVTQVFAGPDARTDIDRAFVSRSADGTVLAEFPLRVPAQTTRHVLAYLSVSRSTADAARAVGVFDRRRPAKPLLAGLSGRVQRSVVNWNL